MKAADGKNPLQVLQEENELLRRTIEAADAEIGDVKKQVQNLGGEVSSGCLADAHCPHISIDGKVSCLCQGFPDGRAASQVPQAAGEGSDADDAEGPVAKWSPAVAPCSTGFLDESDTLPMSNIPEHDGTDCFKWDNSLWSQADHFRVRHLLAAAACLHWSFLSTSASWSLHSR